MTTHERPSGVSDETVAAVGKLSEALETMERTRGRLYDFHQMCGTTDATLADAVSLLRAAGHGDLADRVDASLVGRNVLDGRWSFQIIEEYDAGYVAPFRALVSEVESALVDGRPHVFESEMKDREIAGKGSAHKRRP